MKTKVLFNAFLLILVLAISGCSKMEAVKHEVLMKGQVLEVANDSAYLCIGSKDGAEVGDRLTVYRFTRAVNPDSKYAEDPSYKREDVGTIKITKIVDEHMAKARILTGEVHAGYLVELHE